MKVGSIVFFASISSECAGGGLLRIKSARTAHLWRSREERGFCAISRSRLGHGGKYESRVWHADTASTVQFIIYIVFQNIWPKAIPAALAELRQKKI